MAESSEKRDPSSHRTPTQIKRMDSGYNHTPVMRKHRSMNNQARRIYKKEHGAASVEGKDVDHKDALRHGGGNYKKNLQAISPAKNRGWRDPANGVDSKP